MLDWFRELSRAERKGFYGAFLGHAVDVFDFMIYSFLISTLLAQWGMSKSMAGAIVTWTLVSSLVGAIGAGLLADRFGRVRVLRWTILVFAVSCFLCGISTSPEQLMMFRMLQGLGFGGESSLCMVLVTELIRNPAHRGKYSGFTASSYSFGWGGAAIAYAITFNLFEPEVAWRVCFFLGILPALVVVYLRRNLQEPEVFLKSRAERGNVSAAADLARVFRGPLLRKTVLCSLLSGGMLGAYYAIATWLPTFLKTERGLSVFGTSSYLAVTILGSLVGYVAGAYATDRWGRRLTYMAFAAGAFVMAMIYMVIPVSNTSMLFLGFPLGVLMQGVFSGIGATISESYPSSIRATGYGVSYNLGRVIGSFFPLAVGWLNSGRTTLALAIAMVAGVGYALVMVSAAMLPETSGIDLGQAGGGDDGEAKQQAAAEPVTVAPTAGRPA
ncbi:MULTISPECIES: MFS transporter [Cupriavidus]|jgi:MFS family permease|uniref:Major facilitator superfamily (MFS_1) transporter n=1 Tax=Cupriavidus metallidurans (strain ATCC 43123 / DSM 2839 / NBRC 102507 / CH34) TaxID=266264 RepID=Q1LR44_CUPMC|nr:MULTISPECIES: MFS transporter [Cupriavidus]ABF07382.1 Major facilitator superfamily (MFS_1) transporter [Cupriavidus metallidurans CH34]AVA32632.1 MFS transporter [Cupriavidus metallidurans]EKZ95594.1 major facilitator superfamily transporter [Cupriavidus sp. HMR-1]QGS28285.1 MFS transporter [Cupriavidus metallidurans]UBM11493.1 MFS transporter [Cupriavidus metallidurans]